eukprot:9779-Lingulodinium_polyedra.AAC.1
MDVIHEHGVPPSELDVDVLTGDFPWLRFLMGRPFGRALLNEGLVQMRLVCNRAEEPVIQVTTSAAPG